MKTARRADEFPYFDNGGLPLAFAHRGGALTASNSGLENSMAAFQAAVDLGYRYLETDVRVTKDGVLVAFHDALLDRMTSSAGAIAEHTLAELAGVRIGGREPIPVFEELLMTWPGVRINIDAKDARAVVALSALINRLKVWDRVCVASFSPQSLRTMRRLLGPRVATAQSAIGAGVLRLLPGATLRRLALGNVGQAAQVPVRRGPIEVVTPQFIDRAHALGKQVHVWTVDTPDEVSRLLDLGVDGIFTDRIDVLRDVYQGRGIWKAYTP